MSIALKDSKTKKNLMRAFAGESQARNRYQFAAHAAKQQQLHVVEAVFNFTASQEQAHAKAYYDLLKEFAGDTITVDGTYPVDIHEDIVKLLRAAQHNEYQEYEHDYAEFAKIAQEEAFPTIANMFHMIAQVEQTHGERFGRFAELIEKKELFHAETDTKWMCLQCGRIHTGKDAPMICPICGRPQGYFIRWDMAPFQP